VANPFVSKNDDLDITPVNRYDARENIIDRDDNPNQIYTRAEERCRLNR
jgi:hypothetical protein